jgi:type IV secretion system protein VirD4
LIIMSATKILWEQIAIVVAIVLATMWAATQWVAWRLGFQPQLGHPWFELLSGVPIYFPPAFFWWWYAYDAYAPHVFVEGAYIASSGGFISIAVAVAMSVWRAREAKTAATYGSARWATRQEIRAARLTAPDGVVLGRFEREHLRGAEQAGNHVAWPAGRERNDYRDRPAGEFLRECPQG